MKTKKLANRAKRDYAELISLAKETDRGKYSCDLAEDFWMGRVMPDQIIKLLQHRSNIVRSAAMFAALDQSRLNEAAEFLLKQESVDTDPCNRRQLAAFIRRCDEILPGEKRGYISRFVGDPDTFVQKICRSIMGGDA